MRLHSSLRRLQAAAENPTNLRIAYKLAAEAFFLVLILAAGFFLAEVILPGFITARINFSSVYLALIVFGTPLFLLSNFSEKKTASVSDTADLAWKPILFFSLLLTLLLVNDTQDLGTLQRSTTVLAVFLGTLGLLSLFLASGKPRKK